MARNMNKIRRQLESKRKKRPLRNKEGEAKYTFYPHHADAPYHEPEFYKWQEWDNKKSVDKPEVKQNGAWILQSLAAVTLFLLIGILFQTNHPALEGARSFVATSFEEEFPFAEATAWYEETFGSPLAFLPFQDSLERPVAKETPEQVTPLAVPVSGTITESFSENGKGIVLNTGEKETVEAVKGGVIIHAGPHEEWDLAVAVQHYEGGESWYGLLDQVDVKLYDHVTSGTTIGRVSGKEEEGRYSLAMKEKGEYIDPADVISIE
ncbi:peptidoglycan DD-metalloendopeptidase family protein [Alteribacillus iranensis]|uniref:Stage IV sporulation protein FA n=1 Tax=Alteribacillus iranensis TaxID=930128 RepID=A0A1I2CRG5_9BACI|nr:peptidoglycan DD-metalloendopeptidase family protein [Alteribacillus iranensis]SFE70886.1 stage IV sporulation protein FA [Alteribacillus iranensis]